MRSSARHEAMSVLGQGIRLDDVIVPCILTLPLPLTPVVGHYCVDYEIWCWW